MNSIYLSCFSFIVSCYMSVKADTATRNGQLSLDMFFCLLVVSLVGSVGCSVNYVRNVLYLGTGNSVSYSHCYNRLTTLVSFGYVVKVGGIYTLSLQAEKMLFSNFDKKAFAQLHQELAQVIKDHKVKAPRKPKKTIVKKAKK